MRVRPPGTGGRGRFVRYGAALLVVAAFAVAFGSAHATTSTKFYAASIAPTGAAAGSSSAELTLTLTNTTASTQTLGSANFSPPTGWKISSPAAGTSRRVDSDEVKWTVANAANVIQLRAASPGDALAPGHSVSATVATGIPCSAVGTAAWTTQAKQSNSFNGPPGNDFVRTGPDPTVTVAAAGGGSLASLVFDAVGRQALTTPFQVTVTAKDACGFTKTDYSGATLTGTLAGSPTYGAFTWSHGVGTATVTPSVSQTGATVTASDGAVSGTSNSFDVFDAICTANTLCEADNASTHVSTLVDSNSPATMALTLSAPGATFTCNNGIRHAVGSLVTLDPRDYAGKTYLATLRYSKDVAPGTGVANFVVCLGEAGVFTELAPCKNAAPARCIDKRNRNGVGELVIVLRLDPSDPVGGTY